jgi:hypothetical protein
MVRRRYLVDKDLMEDPRQEAQYDPKNKRPVNALRIRWSFLLIALIVLALSLTAVMIWTQGR